MTAKNDVATFPCRGQESLPVLRTGCSSAKAQSALGPLRALAPMPWGAVGLGRISVTSTASTEQGLMLSSNTPLSLKGH